MYTDGGNMINFENQLDDIRIKLYEETKDLDKFNIISTVNSHARKIAQEFGIKIIDKTEEEYFQILST